MSHPFCVARDVRILTEVAYRLPHFSTGASGSWSLVFLSIICTYLRGTPPGLEALATLLELLKHVLKKPTDLRTWREMFDCARTDGTFEAHNLLQGVAKLHSVTTW